MRILVGEKNKNITIKANIEYPYITRSLILFRCSNHRGRREDTISFSFDVDIGSWKHYIRFIDEKISLATKEMVI